MSALVTIDVAAIVERQRPGAFLVRLVILSWIITFFDGFDMNVISFAAPYLATQYALDRSMLGDVFSAGVFGTMIGGFLFGDLGDRIGRRPAIILATVLFGLLTLALALAQGYWSLVGLRLVDGIAIGGMLPLAWALNIEYSPRRLRSTIVTLVMIGYSLGSGLGGPVANALIPRFGWQSVFLAGGALSLVAAAALVLYLPESVRFLTIRARAPGRTARLLRRLAPGEVIPDEARYVMGDEEGAGQGFTPALLFRGALRWITPFLWLAYIASSVTVFAFANWMPIVFEAVGLSRGAAASAASANAVLGALGGLLLMRFTDRVGAIAITALPLAAVPVLLVIGLTDLDHVAFVGLVGLSALLLTGGHFGLHSIAGIFYPSEYRGNGAGWATSVAKVGSVIGPKLAGLVLATSLPARSLFAVLAVCPMIFAVSIYLVGRRHRRLRHAEALEALG